jgi:hypothetical protein
MTEIDAMTHDLTDQDKYEMALFEQHMKRKDKIIGAGDWAFVPELPTWPNITAQQMLIMQEDSEPVLRLLEKLGWRARVKPDGSFVFVKS